MLKPRLLLLISAMALTLSVPVYAEAPATKALTLDQIMADPDWIGTPVERVWWAHDSQSVLFTRKRDGQPIRETPWAARLESAGFSAGYRGMTFRG